MMKKGLAVVLALMVLVVLGSASVMAEGKLTLMGVWGGQELEAFNKVVESFTKASGIEVQMEMTRDLPTLLTTRVEAGNPPDIVHLTGLGLMKEHVEDGNLVNLEEVLDMNALEKDFNKTWIDLATYNDGVYGVYISADIKSLVWYNPEVFAERGYEVPGTWAELQALEQEMVANGDIPWSVGLESGSASGWPGTDWIEDIMLRTTSPEVYDQWVNHDIPWTDERVKRAFEIFGEIVRDPEMVWGGPTAVLATNFGEGANPLFTDPPQAMMHRQASFITSFIKENNPDVVAGKDYDFFMFPEINPEYGVPALGAADMIAMMNDTPEARAFMNYLITPGAQSIWVGDVGKLGINKRIHPNHYPDNLTRRMADALQSAPVFRFDGSDSMPGAVGAGAFWEGVVNYVGGEDLDSVLEYIESVADDSYTGGAATD